jgi:HK97 gp10 family phage protein
MPATYKPNRTAAKTVRAAALRAAAAAAIEFQKGIKKELGKRSSNKGNGGKPSPAGEPPALRTGTLRRSIQVDFRDARRGVVRVGTNLEYAPIHEFGGRIRHPGGQPYVIVGPGKARFIKKSEVGKHGKRVRFTGPHTINMPRRPFMLPAFEKTKKKALSTARKAYRQRIKATR